MLALPILILLMVNNIYGRAWSGHYDRSQLYPIDYNDDYYAPITQPINPYYNIPRTYEDMYRGVYNPYYYEDLQRNGWMESDEERAAREALLPVGQEILYEGEPTHWRRPDEIEKEIYQNALLAEMAAEARKQQRETRDNEDEDVRELKALAGKPLYHVPKTQPHTPTKLSHTEEDNSRSDYYEYPSDESFINWGSKRSISTEHEPTTVEVLSSTTSTLSPNIKQVDGQKEVVMPRPATPIRHPFPDPMMKLLERDLNVAAQNIPKEVKSKISSHTGEDQQRLKKRFVTSDDSGLVSQLRGLKIRMST